MAAESLPQDRIVELRVKGLRTLEDVRLELEGLRVLIGDNGSGKSSILEALELLRKAAKPGDFVRDTLIPHGFSSLLRRGATELSLGVRIVDRRDAGESPIDYGFTVAWDGSYPQIVEEHLHLHAREGGSDFPIIQRDARGCFVVDQHPKLFTEAHAEATAPRCGSQA